MERRQAPNETADNFITEIVKLKNQMLVHVDEALCKRAERNIAKRSGNRMLLGNTRKVYEVHLFEEPASVRCLGKTV